jgi:hypothetical protein
MLEKSIATGFGLHLFCGFVGLRKRYESLSADLIYSISQLVPLGVFVVQSHIWESIMSKDRPMYCGTFNPGDQFTNATGAVATVHSCHSDGNSICFFEPNPSSYNPERKTLVTCGKGNFLRRYPYPVEVKAKKSSAPAQAVRTWTTGWWIWKKTVDVEATQEASRGRCPKGSMSVKARVIIDGTLRFQSVNSWCLPPGERNLLVQVFMIARLKSLRLTFWARALEEFVYLVDPHFEFPEEASDLDPQPLVMWQEIE